MILKLRPGMSLIELMFAFTFGSIISLMLYKIFITTQKTTAGLREINTAQSTRILVQYHLKNDAEGILLPLSLSEFYKICKELTKKDGKDDKKDQESKKLYDAYSSYCPVGKIDNGAMSISFITTRSLLTRSNSPCRTRVTYIFKKNQKEQSIFSLIRKEESFSLSSEKDENEKKEVQEYTLINRIENPSIVWYLPLIDEKEIQEKEKEEFEKVIAEWIEEPVCKKVETFEMPELEKFTDHPFLPYGFSITGNILGDQGSRHLPFDIMITFPNLFYSFDQWIIAVKEKDKKEVIHGLGKDKDA